MLLARGIGEDVASNAGIVELWPSQAKALANGLLSDNSSMIVRMPTSAGKTRIAEMAMIDFLIKSGTSKCVYIAPFRALAGELENSLSGLFSDLGFRLATTLGSYESDEFEQALVQDADVIISTPEKLDYLTRVKPEILQEVGLVILDEGQLVADTTRGAHFELLLSRVLRRNPQIRVLSLSAVMSTETLEELAAWLRIDPSHISQSEWRPAVQRVARFEWQGSSGVLRYAPENDAQGIDQFVPKVIESKTFAFKNSTTGRVNRQVFPRLTHKAETAAELAYQMSRNGPVLVFCTQTNHADSVAKALLRRLQLSELTGDESRADFSTAQTRSVAVAREWLGPQHPVTTMLEKGIAIHHGRIPDAIKKAIEQDFRERQYHIIVATSTLAQGVNLPIKTVIIHTAARRIDGDSVPIPAREYWNIAGRAGRATEETEGTIIHICTNASDQWSYRSYVRRRSSLEPLTSSLLDWLRRLATQRISFEDGLQYLDADLLAILAEENVSEVTDEWLASIFDGTLASIQASVNQSLQEGLRSALGRGFRSVLQRVPDSSTRQIYAATGLSVASCDALMHHILENSDELSVLFQNASIADRHRLQELFLEGSLLAAEIQTVDEITADIFLIADAWMLGSSIATLRNVDYSGDLDSTRLLKYVEDAFGYRLPWGISAYLSLAIAELNIDETNVAEVVRFFPAMIKFGLPTPQAVWCINAGIPTRSLAISISQEYLNSTQELSIGGFLEWLSSWGIEGLRLRFGLTGVLLQDVSRALQKARPSPYIRNAPGLGPHSSLNLFVRITGEKSELVASMLNEGDDIQIERDYDAYTNRNAIICSYQGEILGGLPNQVAQWIAPLMDIGRRYSATFKFLESRGTSLMLGIELFELTME